VLNLLIILIALIVNNVEESQLVHALGGGDHAQPISELLLLEEFLRQVLQIPARKRNMRDDLDLPVSNGFDVNVIAQIPGATLDLDAIVQELLEGTEVEDLVRDGLRAVDCVLVRNLRALDRLSSLGGRLRRCTTSLDCGHLGG